MYKVYPFTKNMYKMYKVQPFTKNMDKMDKVEHLYSDAGTYAMAGMHQVYTYDPSMNFIEINQEISQ